MNFRLTYALKGEDKINTVEIKSDAMDILQAYEESIDYIEMEEGNGSSIKLEAISIYFVRGKGEVENG